MLLPYPAHRLKLLETKAPGSLLIHEIYLSVQGESTFAGLPCVFVRTAVCDLRCAWCDTPHAFNRGERMGRLDVPPKGAEFRLPTGENPGGRAAAPTGRTPVDGGAVR